ncbi:MAG: ATPase [Novosphingobium sp.]
MTGGSRIVAIGGETVPEVAEAAPVEAPLELEASAEVGWEEEWDESPAPSRFAGWLAPSLALLAIAAWSAFFGWANHAAILEVPSPEQAVALVRDWAIPTLLVCTLWLLAMRTSRREAVRFGEAARALNAESANLETRLSTVNQELSLAREFIASQSRDIESLGRVAVERLSQHADKLAGLIQDNGARVDTIGSVSSAALENMEKLRGQLPVIASSAKDVTNHIATAGRTAQGQLQEMVNGFTRLNEFGQASERQVLALNERIDAALGEFAVRTEQLEQATGQRFAALREDSEAFRAQLDGDEVAALAAIRTRAAALGEELAEVRGQLDGEEAESLTSLRARLAAVRDEGTAIGRALRGAEATALDAWREAGVRLEDGLREALGRIAELDDKAVASARDRIVALSAEAASLDDRLIERDRHFAEELAARRAAEEARSGDDLARLTAQWEHFDATIAARRMEQDAQARHLTGQSERIAAHLADFSSRVSEITEHGQAAETALAASLETLATKLIASREALAGTDGAIAGLTDSSVRLLELIQASAQHSQVELPAAINAGDERLAVMEQRASALLGAVEAAATRGEELSSYVLATREELVSLESLHGALGERGAEHGRTLDRIRVSLQAVEAESTALAGKAQDELKAAIDALALSARDAVAGIETMSAAGIAALAERLGEESGAALDRAIRTRAAEVSGQLEQAAAHASGISREAAIQLRDQLAKVNELAGNLEQRVAQARNRAEEQVDHDFARRVALITESLNSNAIDIARALDADVSDTAWSAYLKGDRGVFTRRAVRLLEPAEAKAVSAIYESDRDFRDHVSRYIHDFEAMLRQLLSTRDGHALGVTLLSSDMGKLYVALAQAIERLRA